MRGLVILLACGVLGMQCAHAADPQPYKIDWTSSRDKAIDSTMKLTSQLETLRETAPTDPFGLIARARGDVGRLQTVLQSFGYYDGSVTIKINGLGLDSEDLGNVLSALPSLVSARRARTANALWMVCGPIALIILSPLSGWILDLGTGESCWYRKAPCLSSG